MCTSTVLNMNNEKHPFNFLIEALFLTGPGSEEGAWVDKQRLAFYGCNTSIFMHLSQISILPRPLSCFMLRLKTPLVR